ncbi:MAG: TIM barrel protein [Candidatus Caldatribacteriota bacterium]
MLDRTRIALNRIIFPSLDLENFFRFTFDLGIKKIELRNDLTGKGIIDAYSPEQVKRLLKKYNLEILTINALQKFNLSKIFPQLIQELQELIDLSLAIGNKAIVLCPNNEPLDQRSSKEAFQETVKALKSFAFLFERNNLWGYVEPLGFPESSLNSIIKAQEAIQQSGCSRYKIVFDTFHHYLGPDTLEIIQNKLDPDNLGLIHLSGVESTIPLEEFRDKHRVLVSNQDRLKSKEQIDLLSALGYQGDISLEPFSPLVQVMKIEEIKLAIQKSIEYLSS